MRFYHKTMHNIPPRSPRIITKFLFLPLTIGNETRWLEKSSYIQTSETNFKKGKICWYNRQWVD